LLRALAAWFNVSMRNVTVSIIALLISTACATPATVLYAPGSLTTGHGDLRVEKFRYRPAESGRLAPNEIASTAARAFEISENVNEYVSNAVKSELKYAGFDTSRGDLTLSGTIENFTADDFGFSVDWKLAVMYRLRQGDSVLYEKLITVTHKTSKGMAATTTGINKSIRMSFDSLMEDPKVGSLISARRPAASDGKPTAAR
jgi:hypothetical protein